MICELKVYKVASFYSFSQYREILVHDDDYTTYIVDEYLVEKNMDYLFRLLFTVQFSRHCHTAGGKQNIKKKYILRGI